MSGIWLDYFSFSAFLFILGFVGGLWIGMAHGAQIESLFARFRRQPRVTPNLVRAVLFDMQDRAHSGEPVLWPSASEPEIFYWTDREGKSHRLRIESFADGTTNIRVVDDQS